MLGRRGGRQEEGQREGWKVGRKKEGRKEERMAGRRTAERKDERLVLLYQLTDTEDLQYGGVGADDLDDVPLLEGGEDLQLQPLPAPAPVLSTLVLHRYFTFFNGKSPHFQCIH